MSEEWLDWVIAHLEDWDFESALRVAQKAAKATDAPSKKGWVYLLVSALAEQSEDQGERGAALYKALDIFRSTGDREGEIHTLILLGSAHLERDAELSIDDALNCYAEAFKVALHREDLYPHIATIFNGIGVAIKSRDSRLSKVFLSFGSMVEKL